MVRLIQSSLIGAAVLLVGSCGAFKDPVTQELSRNGLLPWMEQVDLRQVEFSEGSDVNRAATRLSEWGWQDGEHLMVVYERQLQAPLPEGTLVFTKADSNLVCGLNRFVFIEHVDGEIVSATGATGEAGCL